MLFDIESTIGGATGIPNEEQTTYYILWNIDKEESEKCIEEYNEIQFNKNVNIVDLIDPVEISKIINKYLGEQGLISVLLEKAEPEINKLFDNSLDKPQYGDALKNPEKWRVVPTTEIK